jgi:Pyruvate/2-oxoacid:ferredoxin oxidoreductase delta subunit
MNDNNTDQERMISCSICKIQFLEPKEKDLAIFKWSTDEHSTVAYSFCKPCAEMVGDIIEAIASRREQKDNEE